MFAIDRFDCVRVEIPFKSLSAEYFKDNDLDELMQHMFAHVKRQVQNSRVV